MALPPQQVRVSFFLFKRNKFITPSPPRHNIAIPYSNPPAATLASSLRTASSMRFTSSPHSLTFFAANTTARSRFVVSKPEDVPFSPSNVTDKGGAMGDERPSDITLRSSEKFDWMCDGRAEGRGGEVDSISGGSNAKIEV